MRKYIGLLFCLLFSLIMPIGAQSLSRNAQVSLLTSSPYEGEVFTLYGHTALRIQDNNQKIDYVFNYGIFSFSQPNFIYRFAKGETDYMLGVMKYEDYIVEYQMRGSTVTEQVLNLLPEEKERIWAALLENYKPENREYRYNFFFDNCATRPASLIEKGVNGAIDYRWTPEEKSFRNIINYCTRNHPWLTFGCDLALGSPTDRPITPHEMFFLPEYLKEGVASAVIVSDNGSERPLVAESHILEAEPDDEIPTEWFSPLVCATLLLLITLLLTYWEWRKGQYFAWLDAFLFLLAGLGGCILFFLGFISEHPCTWPNWTLLWLHPLQLLVVPLSFVKKLRKAGYYYHFINFAAAMLIIVGWNFIPQHFNSAFIPLIITLGIRSGSVLIRHKKARNKIMA